MNVFQVQSAYEALPEPGAVVSGPQVRFTVLTSRLLRMEYSPAGQFEDRPSQAFWQRHLPLPEFQLCSTPESIEIETEYLHLHYQISAKGFAASTLSIEVKTTEGYGHVAMGVFDTSGTAAAKPAATATPAAPPTPTATATPAATATPGG